MSVKRSIAAQVHLFFPVLLIVVTAHFSKFHIAVIFLLPSPRVQSFRLTQFSFFRVLLLLSLLISQSSLRPTFLLNFPFSSCLSSSSSSSPSFPYPPSSRLRISFFFLLSLTQHAIRRSFVVHKADNNLVLFYLTVNATSFNQLGLLA